MLHHPHHPHDTLPLPSPSPSPLVSPCVECDTYIHEDICNPITQPEYMVLKGVVYWRGYILEMKYNTTEDSAFDAIGLRGYPVRGDIQGHFDLIQFINLVHSLEVAVMLFSHGRVVLLENNEIIPMSYTEDHPSIEFHCVYYDGLFYHELLEDVDTEDDDL